MQKTTRIDRWTGQSDLSGTSSELPISINAAASQLAERSTGSTKPGISQVRGNQIGAEVKTLPTILVVEDNPSDVELLRYFIHHGPTTVSLAVAADGVEALRMLRGEPPYPSAFRPELILLDLNLPRKDGRQVLAELKQDPDLQQIPVIILSTSGASRDVYGAYQLHANCYLQKPTTVEEFRKTVQGIEEFWLSLAKLPPVVSHQ